MTITEALAEIKTIEKRIASKQSFVEQYLVRVDSMKDPHEDDGGSAEVITHELQAIGDLETRIVDLRTAIQKVNTDTVVTLEGVEKTIAEWLIWRREVAPKTERFFFMVRNKLNTSRDIIRRQGIKEGEKPADIIININEKEFATQSERLQTILGQLDGQLSLKNATVQLKI